MAEEPKPGVTYTIGGVKVEFPVKAYPSQISMMDKIIRGCHRAQNCLLESPTGSGKTLALLCGAVAWQKAEAKRLGELVAVEHGQKVHQMLQAFQESQANAQKLPKTDLKEIGIANVFNAPARSKFKYDVESDDEDENCIFIPNMKKMKTDDVTSPVVDLTAKEDRSLNPESNPAEECPEEKDTLDPFSNFLPVNIPPPKPRIPKIFFGTRTHKQIAQVLHELRRTAYADVRSCILSSRNHSCIHEMGARPNVNRNDLCHDLLDPRTFSDCRYYHNVKRFSHYSLLQPHGVPSVWDLEDLIKFGKQKSSCPYFMAREMMTSSDVIFCPYNYLLDPLIRASMNITLTGNVLILDEAHNIEDTCRESASFSISQENIFDAIKNCEEIAAVVACEESYRSLAKVLSSVSTWIDQHKNEVTDLSDYDVGKWMIFGPQAVDSFADYEFGRSNFPNFVSTFEEINQLKNEEDNADSESISGATKTLITGLILVLQYLYDDRHTRDYHIALTKNFSHESSENLNSNSQGWFNMRKNRNRVAKWNYTLNFWCLNPAVVFEEIRAEARSVVLTSGTLSPMDSFQSELGANFPITLEANHVIDSNQCLIRSLGFGPNNVCLDGKYASTNTYQFQDEIGDIILRICSFVPHGVLCFVPSYSLLNKLHERWQLTGALEKIAAHKEIVCEPRRSNEFEPAMRSFYETIDRTSKTAVGQGLTGALFLAVCRGKVSEGLDFADKNARVIITIGIPFPNIRDSQVTLKKAYNDQHKVSKNLLSGSDWYQIQAFRALNQALGRCIRHRNDWGALLLIDNRFSNHLYYKSLSKWMRNKVQHHSNYNELIHQLRDFIECRLRVEREANNGE